MPAEQVHQYQSCLQPSFVRVPAPCVLHQVSSYAHLQHNTGPVRNPDRQALNNTSFCFSPDMPNFPAMSNSALVSALLASPQRDQEQEQERQSFSLINSFLIPQTLQEKSSDLLRDDLEGFPGPAEQKSSSQNGQAEYFPERHSNKQQKRKLSATSDLGDDDYVDEGQVNIDNNQRARRPQRLTRRKKSQDIIVDDGILEQEVSCSPSKESKQKRKSSGKITRKARAGRLIRKKPIGMPVPKKLSEAGPADRMMWEWKNQGKNWEEIRTEWKKLTGIEPGGSSLSVRYIKLVENLARNGAAGDIELLRFKREAEEELMAQLWHRVAEKMLIFSPESEHNPKDLQKRYNMIIRSGYDVEKVLADSEVKNEPEPIAQSASDGDDEFDHNQFAMDLERMSSYENPVVGGPIASNTEQDATVTDCRNITIPYSGGSHLESEGSHNMFEPVCILHPEVDGLNEQSHFEDNRHLVRDQFEADHNMYIPTIPSYDRIVARSEARGYQNGPCTVVAYPLVEYDSNSD